MPTPTKLPKPSDFVVILNYDFESLPLEPVPLQVYGTTASRLQLNRVELKSDLKTYFKDSIPDLSDAVYVGQTKGGPYRVVMDMSAYISRRLESDMHVQELRRSFSRSFPKFWLSSRRVVRRLTEILDKGPEIRVLPKSVATKEQIDSLFGYPTGVTRRAKVRI